MKYLFSILGLGILPVMAMADEVEPALQNGCWMNGQQVPCSEAWAMIAPFLIPLVLASVVIFLFFVIVMWRIFTKAGKPGWASLIPIYNTIVLIQIVNKPVWWILLFLIPFVNVIIMIIVYHRLSLSFGKDVGFTLGIIFLGFIFLPILAFGSAQYHPLPD